MDWQKALISKSATIHETIAAIEASMTQICLVVDDSQRLLGTITDGDIRRAILDGLGMDASASEIMNTDPRVASEDESRNALLEKMANEYIRQIPILDHNKKVVDLACIDDLLSEKTHKPNWVVLMAGGLGTRLRPLTNDRPKPLIPVGNKPLLETIIETFVQQNFHQFYLSINYKAEMIKDHFTDGKKWNADIRYLEEDQRLGTAGPLGLMPEELDHPLIVMNSDLLTRVNFQQLLDYHKEHGAKATMCVREYDFQVPFGVVGIEDNQITGIDEKPVHNFFVNAGIYVLEPEILKYVQKDEAIDMTQLFERIIAAGHKTSAYPVHEYWLDIGQMGDYEQANADFTQSFGTD
ncbi:nucleotidyltransferase family protein [bacterium]|nr:nucleotidyltransferase family protein [bacterium]